MDNESRLYFNYMYNTRNDGEPGKVVLECPDGRILAHRDLLKARSEYFRAMFNHKLIENETNVVHITDATTEVMNVVIQHLYRQDEGKISDSLMREILFTADKIQLKGLFDKYWLPYSTNITPDNFLTVWQLAEMTADAKTIRNVERFVLKQSKHISEADVLSDMTITQLRALVARSRNNEIPELINLIVTWGMMKNEMESAWELISKCDIERLSDYSFQDLIFTKNIIESPSICNAMISTWLTAIEPRMKIHAFEFRRAKCRHLVKNLRQKGWITSPEQTLQKSKWLPVVSTSENTFYFKFFNRRFLAIDSTTLEPFCQRKITESQFSMSSDIEIETANRTDVYFKTGSSYARFNIDKKRWTLVTFFDRYVHDCKSMLLATADGKFVFDVDGGRIKIIDTVSGTWEMKEKMCGDWLNVRCRNLSESCAGKLIFHQKAPSCLLVYDFACDYWCVVSTPEITGTVFMCVCYESDCLIFEKTNSAYKVYSLKTMRKVGGYRYSKRIDGYIHFDVSVDTGTQ